MIYKIIEIWQVGQRVIKLCNFISNMQQRFFTNLLFLVGINVVIKPFYLLGIDRTVQNTVGPENYGFYWGLFNFIYLFQVVNDLGLQNFTSTFVSQSRRSAQKYFPYLFSIKGVASLIFILLVMAGTWFLGYRDLQLIIPIIISQVAVSVVFFFRSNLAGLGHYTLDSALSVLDKALMILLCGYWLLFRIDDFSIYHFARLQALSLVVTAVICGILVWKHLGPIKWGWDRAFIGVLWKKSAPFALVFILTTLMTRVDSVMIERMLGNGAYEAGMYAAGYRLLEACNMFAFLFIGLLLPMFAHIHKDRVASSELLDTAVRLMWTLVCVLSATSLLFAQPIMSLLYDGATPQWVDVFSLLMMGFVPMGLSYIGGAVLLANHQVRSLNIIYVSGMVFNVLGNAYIIPKSGAQGAALITLLTQTLVAIGCFYLIFIKLQLHLSRSTWLRLLVLAGGIAVFAWWHDWGQWFEYWPAEWALIGLLFVVWAAVLGMIPWELLRGRFQKKSV